MLNRYDSVAAARWTEWLLVCVGRDRDLSGNKFTKVVPEMFLGNVNDSEGTFTTQTAPLTQLKVMYVATRATNLDVFRPLTHDGMTAFAAGRHLDLNPVAVVNEHAFDTTPSLKLM
jgi:hypothetical protein